MFHKRLRPYRTGSWTMRQLVHHIADSQLNMYQRLKLALTDENPTVPDFDQEKWAIQPDTKLPIESSNEPPATNNESFLKWGFPTTLTTAFQQDKWVTPLFCDQSQESLSSTTVGNNLPRDKKGRN